MNREIIKLTEFEVAPILYEWAVEGKEYEEYFDEDGDIIGNPIWNDFEIIEEIVDYYDIEKGYENKSTVVKRKSDGDYFIGRWIDSPYVDNTYETTLTQVFPKEKTITVYE